MLSYPPGHPFQELMIAPRKPIRVLRGHAPPTIERERRLMGLRYRLARLHRLRVSHEAGLK